ncbi:alpha/beta fold hydrolase [Orrella sp. 11846]|uniref:alpha/beta fold hydrolase n=1 Tax=Orrella sp. 11846 TaxID=3409913 RepID=UPI003B5C7A55
MSAPRVESIACSSPTGIHQMAYYDWGDPDNPDVLLCVHGLTRNGRDFDEVAKRLSKRFRVVCPDVVGRGLSDWLVNPAGYQVPQYAADMVSLIGRLQPKTLNWVGTSMGGLIAMVYSALVAKAQSGKAPVPPARLTASIPDSVVPITRLVLNDVGPRVEPESLARIGAYLGDLTQYDSFEEGLAYMRQTAQSFGLQTDEQWEMFTRHYFVQKDGHWIKHYDPNIAMGFAGMTPEMMAKGEEYLWHVYSKITSDILVLHGVESDLLTAESVARMQASNARTQVRSIEGVGHAPSLLKDHEIDLLESFLV